MIKELHIKNFKSINEMSINLGRINIFIGAPNSGKSNILEAIGALSMIGYDPSRPKTFLRFDRIIDLFYDQQTKKPIEISTDNGKNKTVFEFVNNKIKILTFDGNRYDYDMRGEFRGVEGNSDLSWYKQFKYYLFKKDIEFRQDNYEGLSPPFGSNLPMLIYSNNEIKSMFENIMSEFHYEPIVDPYDNNIKVMKKARSLKVLLPYEVISEGLRRLIFFKTSVLSNEKSIITMEEPESYLFPYYVSNFAESLGLREDDNTYLIATHNIYLLQSIIEKTPKDQLKVFITHMNDGETKITELSSEEIITLFDEDPFHKISSMVNNG